MERLTIKELAPYLPYDLKGVDYFQEHRLIRDITLHNVMAIVDGDTKLKPLLRPLSSLTHHEMNVLRSMRFRECYQWTKTQYNWIKEVKSFPTQQRYDIVQKLHEWHFDTANLIGRKLALPIDGKEVDPLTCGYCDSKFSKGTGGNYGEYGEVCINCYEGLS